MPRLCGPCSDPGRNEIDRRLLNMVVSNESYRTISNDFGYTESALKRHKSNHLVIDLADVHQVMVEARERELSKIRQRELEKIEVEASDTISDRLDNAESYLDKLNVVLHEAADLLDRAKAADDLRAAGAVLGRLTDQLRLMAELAGKLQTQPQINILVDPKWIELRTTILLALDPFPEAKEAVVHAIRE